MFGEAKCWRLEGAIFRQSDTTSIRDTIRNYRTLHGRTFHNYGDTEYWFVSLSSTSWYLNISPSRVQQKVVKANHTTSTNRGPNDEAANEQWDIGYVHYFHYFFLCPTVIVCVPSNYYGDTRSIYIRTKLTVCNIRHQLYTLILDSKLFLAPIGDNPQKVLDVGTGTGIWAMYVLPFLLPLSFLSSSFFLDVNDVVWV